MNNIELSPKNPYFKFIDDKRIRVGKLNKKSDDFDVIYFVIQNDEQIKIQSNIKCIKSHAFYKSPNIKSIEFPSDSRPNYIEESAFDFLSIERIVIPKKVKFLFCKVFENCKNIKAIKFADGSENEWVFDNVFGSLPIESINVPPHLKTISKELFKNSKLSKIDHGAFNNTGIIALIIPASVKLEKFILNGTYAFIEFLGDKVDLTDQYFQFGDNPVVFAFPDAKNFIEFWLNKYFFILFFNYKSIDYNANVFIN